MRETRLRVTCYLALSEPGQCWTAGRLNGCTGAWRTGWFVCYVAGAGAWASCLCFAGFLGFLGFWVRLRLFSVLCSVFSVFDVESYAPCLIDAQR